MSLLLSCQGISKAFGIQTLFTDIDLVLQSGDRAGLIGPNGSGKSTLLKILAGLTTADKGKVSLQKHTRISYLPQEDIFLEDQNSTVNLYEALKDLDLDEAEQYNRVHTLLSRASFSDSDIPVSRLSGGWRKRLAICRALLIHPDVLLMDEPTNHLDMEGILWLEKLLNATLPESPSAFLMVSHDRRFLENTVNRIVELAPIYPKGSLQVEGSYAHFLEQREIVMLQQQNAEDRLANKVRRETEWLRRGPKARATKAKFRTDEAYRLQDELAEVRTRNQATSHVQIAFDATQRKTKKLLVAKHITKGFSSTTLFSDLDITLSPGTRLGLLGRNGCGKSTLMQLLAAAGSTDGPFPDMGTIETAANVRIVSFDQRREQLDQEQTLRRALAPEGDSVFYQDRSIHVVSWAKRFLFHPDQLETPVNRLSGGEQARILIARLMLQPADILLLDEPTNDLDIPSLDVLEESLLEFPGALVLVTHDRFLLDRICTSILGFNGRGEVQYFADYRQWLSSLDEQAKEERLQVKPKKTDKRTTKKTGKLSYLDQREYDQMEETILAKESRQEEVQQRMGSPEALHDPELLHAYWEELQTLQSDIEQLYSRWEQLEAIKNEEQ